MKNKMIEFLSEQHIGSFAVKYNEGIWCWNAYYAFDITNFSIIFASTEGSMHTSLMKINPYISGTVALNTKKIIAIKGVQFMGVLTDKKSEEKIYHDKFPFTKILKPTLYTLCLTYIKYTQNSKLFGTKYVWEKQKIID